MVMQHVCSKITLIKVLQRCTKALFSPALYLSRWKSQTQKCFVLFSENIFLMNFIKVVEANSRAEVCIQRTMLMRYNIILVAQLLEFLCSILDLDLLWIYLSTSKFSDFFEIRWMQHSNECSIIVALRLWIHCRFAFQDTTKNPVD